MSEPRKTGPWKSEDEIFPDFWDYIKMPYYFDGPEEINKWILARPDDPYWLARQMMETLRPSKPGATEYTDYQAEIWPDLWTLARQLKALWHE